MQIVTIVPIKVVRKVKEKQQHDNAKLHQEAELTVTQAKHEAMSQNVATKKGFTLI